MPINGKKAQALKTNSMLVWSANLPKTAEPKPPIPKARPKNNPAISPTFPGTRSVAYTSIAEKADAMIRPMITDKIAVHNKEAKGSNNVNGATPNIEIQIMYFLPKRSPNGPPNTVPAATAPKNTNK